MTSAASPSAPTSTPTASKGLQITLWVAQVLLALFFLMAGYAHGFVPIEEAAKSATWIDDVPFALARFIGYAEVAGALGLILPAATRVAPWLTPVAAAGLALIMILAIPFHIMRGEVSVIWIHVLVTAVALFVAWGRWKRAPILPGS
jgi:putative oxidoreductase